MSFAPDPTAEPHDEGDRPLRDRSRVKRTTTHRGEERARSERGRSESSAGAWAAAALVLALGALAFGVSAQLRTNDLEGKVRELTRSVATAPEGATRPTAPPTSATPVPTTPSGPTNPNQPEDLGAARQSVVSAYETVYNGSLPMQNRLDFVDGGNDLAGLLQARAAQPGGEVLSQIRGRVENVSFTSSNTATVRYSITIPGSQPFGGRLGESKLVGNTWKVSRAVICNDLQALLQLTCPA